ncbi:Rtf2 RING-finger-domain-containing protein [Fimicolochytrium jonesii]|uniref:Rtf2 RING-finger-domain-containing protein n=1 Tax=Fimicolochytrium jonesii TaxID=1396493 RepID=UPI0022FE9781|nr:Rtf2 RING-finger-domain-containing protein [Fimicolochytrium jonesii]KAI8820451.1 Rtf2 RING-finger-domain-containing protein [Fimicolochytrium jonesii]
MGCDGGSIPKRDELVRVKKAAERADPRMQLIVNWFFCALSKQPLTQPVVADALGKLYNKDAVLEYLLNRGGYGDGDLICKHITSFKDVTTLNLTLNESYTAEADLSKNSATVLGNIDEKPMTSRFACPITGKEMNGKSKFSYLATCGCVMADQALKNVPTNNCLKCNLPYTADDVVPVNPTDEAVIQGLRDRMEFMKEARAKIAEEKKKAKKEAKNKSKSGEGLDIKAIDANGDAIAEAAKTSSGSDGDDKHAATKKRKRSKKNRQDGADDDDDEYAFGGQVKKAASNINMALPNLNDRSVLPSAMRVQSAAIKSLYRKDGPVEEPNFLVRGTFNRFAAGF